MTFWQYAAKINRQLLRFAGFSISSGFGLARQKSPFLQGLGVQFVLWGAINSLIATIGQRQNDRKQAATEGGDTAVAIQERRQLHRLLIGSIFLDAFLFLSGLWVARHPGNEDDNWRGQGVAMMLQSGFLFFFDLWHAWRLPPQQTE